MGVMTFVVALTGSLYLQMQKSKKRADLTAQLNFLKEQYTNIINNDLAWNNTIYASGNPMTCLTNNTNCTPNTVPTPPLPLGHIFTPRDASLIYLDYDPVLNANDGFTVDGAKCTGWVEGVPSLDCPIRIDFIWQPVCPADVSLGCTGPASDITIFFRVQLPDNSDYATINSANYTRKIRREGSIAPKLLFACPNNTDVITGFDVAGQPKCVDGNTVKP